MKTALVGILGLAVALVTQFSLDSWADESDLHHWTQHGLFFWSGVLVGLAGLSLYRRASSQ